jgi:fluoride exporter
VAVDKSGVQPQGNGMFWTLAQVAIGGAIGSVLRYVTVAAFGAPWAVMAVNVLGSFVMGWLFVVLATRATLSPLLMAGVLGGFTTFSAFSLDALRLWQADQPVQAVLYVGLSVGLSLLAVVLGAAFAKGALG